MRLSLLLVSTISLFAASSCSQKQSDPTVKRLETESAIEAEFSRIVPDLYPADSPLPKLSPTVSTRGYAFFLTVEDESELTKLSGTLADLLKKHKVDSMLITLFGSKQTIGGHVIESGSHSFILGSYKLDDDGSITVLNSTRVLTESKDAADALFDNYGTPNADKSAEDDGLKPVP